jgi:hypothetical protein
MHCIWPCNLATGHRRVGVHGSLSLISALLRAPPTIVSTTNPTAASAGTDWCTRWWYQYSTWKIYLAPVHVQMTHNGMGARTCLPRSLRRECIGRKSICHIYRQDLAKLVSQDLARKSIYHIYQQDYIVEWLLVWSIHDPFPSYISIVQMTPSSHTRTLTLLGMQVEGPPRFP